MVHNLQKPVLFQHPQIPILWCPAGNHLFMVYGNNVFPCPNMISYKQDLKIGEWDEKKGYIRIDRTLWEPKRSSHLKGICAPDNCQYSEICQGGCRGFAWIMTGDFHGSPPYCLTHLIDDLSLEE